MASFNYISRRPITPTRLDIISNIGQILILSNAPPIESNEVLEVWSNPTNNRLAATQQGITSNGEFVSVVNPGTTQYYWIRTLLTDTSAYSEWYPVDVSAGVSAVSKLVGANDVSFSVSNSFSTAAGSFNATGTDFVSAYNVWVSAAGGEFIANSARSHEIRFTSTNTLNSAASTNDYLGYEYKIDVYQSALTPVITKGPYTMYFAENDIVKYRGEFDLDITINNFGGFIFGESYPAKRRCFLLYRKVRGSASSIRVDLNSGSMSVRQL